jgi:hypothetical protein
MEYCYETSLSYMAQEDFENLAEEHLIAESTERIHAKCATSAEEASMHLAHAEIHADLYTLYKRLAKNPTCLQRYL